MSDPNQHAQAPGERRSDDQTLAVVAHRIESIEHVMGEVRGDIRKMTEAITKLALVEANQVVAGQAIERAFKVLEGQQKDMRELAGRVATLEQAGPASKRIESWVDKLLMAAVVVILMVVLKKAGLA